MAQIIGFILMVPILVWSILQPVLYTNSTFIQQTIKVNMYEIQKEASIEGHYTEEMYAQFKKALQENHGYNPECIQIKGTENVVERGNDIDLVVTIPKPPMSVWDVVDMGSCARPGSYEPYEIEMTIESEYIP